MKRAIVLSGGGSKGAYQIGVWKALRELNIKYDIVTGTSIGSVNGLMMVQNEYHKASYLWKNIGYNDLFDIEFKNDGDELETYKKYASEFIKNGGMETSKMFKFLEAVFNKKKFFNSKIDFGIVTVNLTKLKPKILKKKDMKDDFLKYILASGTCFPAFQLTSIDNCKFIDGGYYDNLPIQTAIDLGADEIIAIDLGNIGIKKNVNDKNIKIKYIKPRNDLGSFLIFNKFQSRKAIKYGYNDALKVYGVLDGNKYTFKKDSLDLNYKKNGIKYFDFINKKYKNKIDSKIINNILSYNRYNDILHKKDYNYLSKTLNDIIEYAGELLQIDDSKIYNIKTFNMLLKKNINNFEPFSRKHIKELIRKFSKKANRRAMMVYIYNELNEKKLTKIEFLLLIGMYTKEFLVALYIYMV